VNDKEKQVAAVVLLMQKVIPGSKGRRPVVQQSLARALVQTPASSTHGKLLKSSIQAIASRQKITDPAVRTVIWLSERGITPTAGAVSGHLSSQAIKRSGQKFRAKSNAESIALGVEQGAHVAAWVASYIAEFDKCPLWSEVAQQFGWSREIRGIIIHRLIRDSVLVSATKVRSLRPGPRAASLAPVLASA